MLGNTSLRATIAKLRTAIDALQVAVREAESDDLDWLAVRDDLLELEQQRERLEHSIGCLVSDLDSRGAATRDGARSMAALLASRTGLRRAVAGSRAYLATRLRSMPATDASLAAAKITASHAQVLSRALNPRTAEAFARDEAILVGAAEKLTADQLVQVVEHWLRHADSSGPEPIDGDDDVFHLSQTLDGRLKGDFDFGGDLAVRAKAIIDEITTQVMHRDRKARDVDPSDPRAGETQSRRRARAFGELLDRAGSSPKNPACRQPLFNIQTTVSSLTGSGDPLDWKTEVDLAWRSTIPKALLDLWACDAHVSRIVLGADGLPLDVGRAKRVATPAQRRALLARYGGCAVPDCDAPGGWVQIHHLVGWTEGGPTDLANLLPQCSWHHQRIHAGELSVTMVDGQPEFRLADGRVLVDPRAGPQVGAA